MFRYDLSHALIITTFQHYSVIESALAWAEGRKIDNLYSDLPVELEKDEQEYVEYHYEDLYHHHQVFQDYMTYEYEEETPLNIRLPTLPPDAFKPEVAEEIREENIEVEIELENKTKESNDNFSSSKEDKKPEYHEILPKNQVENDNKFVNDEKIVIKDYDYAEEQDNDEVPEELEEKNSNKSENEAKLHSIAVSEVVVYGKQVS